MRYGYVSVEGWAALACWAVVLILLVSTGGKPPCEAVSSGNTRHHDAHQQARPVHRGGDVGSGPGRAAASQQSVPPCSSVPFLAAGIFGLAALVLSARWMKNRFWLARTRLRSEAWYEGRATARRNLKEQSERGEGRGRKA
jgi:hypothetical protein